MKRIVISGGFDPIHPGHIAMIEDAKKYGEVHIIVNSDEWLIRKKGFFFQPKKILKKLENTKSISMQKRKKGFI